MKHVVFLKAGNPYGYGYSAGETGLVRPTSETKANTKTGKEVVVSWGFDLLSKNGIVREASKAEIEAYSAATKAEAMSPAQSTLPAAPSVSDNALKSLVAQMKSMQDEIDRLKAAAAEPTKPTTPPAV